MTTRTLPNREDLRRRFLAEAASAFDLMFSQTPDDDRITCAQRAQRAHELGQQLTIALLQQHANADPSANPDAEQRQPCPRWQRPGQRVSPDDQPLPARPLTVAAGAIIWHRAQYRCPSCRSLVFSAR